MALNRHAGRHSSGAASLQKDIPFQFEDEDFLNFNGERRREH